MEKQYTKLRIWKETLKYLRRIHAETDESMISIVDRLAKEEWQRVDSDLRYNEISSKR